MGLWLASTCSPGVPLLFLQSVTDKLCGEFSTHSHFFPIVCQGIDGIYSYARHPLQFYPAAPCFQFRLFTPSMGVWCFSLLHIPKSPLVGAEHPVYHPCRGAALHPSAAPEECFSMLSPVWGPCSFLCACLGRDQSPAAAPGPAQLQGQGWQARTVLAGRLCSSLSSTQCPRTGLGALLGEPVTQKGMPHNFQSL